MANYYSISTAHETVRCSREDFIEFSDLLELPEDSDDQHNYSAEYYDGGLYLFSEECAEPDLIPEAALKKLGEMMKAEGLDYLQFGVAFTCSKLRPGSHGGYEFRVHSDGNLVYPECTWPETPRTP